MGHESWVMSRLDKTTHDSRPKTHDPAVPPPHSRYALIAQATTAGLLFLLAPAAGYFLGKWIGGWLKLGPIPSWAGAVMGLVSAFVNLIRLTSRSSR
jgi:Putative F0F1-ATPase subunit Ca2+/Mg2+ transporter